MRQVHAKTHCSKGCAAVQFTPQGLCNMLEHNNCPEDTGERQRLGKEVTGNADLHCFRLQSSESKAQNDHAQRRLCCQAPQTEHAFSTLPQSGC